jgi:ent-kaurene oxidase
LAPFKKSPLSVFDEPQHSLNQQCFTLRASFYDVIVVPTSMVREIASLSDQKASFELELHKRFLGKYTGLGFQGPVAGHLASTVRVDLVRNTVEATKALVDEIEYALPNHLGNSEEWSSFLLYNQLTEIVAQVTARVFVGIPLCRDPEWINLMVDYTRHAIGGAMSLADYPQWSHFIMAQFNKKIAVVRHTRKKTRDLLAPILAERRARLQHDPDFRPPQDVIMWSLKESGEAAWDPTEQATFQLNMG